MKLGTLLEKIFKYTGIALIVKKIWGDKCGCEERKQKLDNIKVFRRN
jgi:hypothetical protein